MSFIPHTAGKRVPSPCGSAGSQIPPNVPPPSPDITRGNPQFLRGVDGPSAASGVERMVNIVQNDQWEPFGGQSPPGDMKTTRGNDLKGVLRIQDDEHHCDWAERRIRSLSMSVLGLLFVLIAQGTILAFVVDKVYNSNVQTTTSIQFKPNPPT
ncbi:hypothetical protein BIW11_06726 [Tropilaelaps mercedesae]|uniref:Uncharacterized protein n=1 Tax=Tropilaelaps mercedesae TaxID=418985 RepID=A0A1V9XWS3_9ACAR|nr:hypothetical protein BIW11_06726 [Tropilaelaps mercedesae]